MNAGRMVGYAAIAGVTVILLPILVTLLLMAAVLNPTTSATQQCGGLGGTGTGLTPGSVPNGWEIDVAAAATVAGVPPAILAALFDTESSWNPNAVSIVGALGLGQFLPSTWDAGGYAGDPTNPNDAIAATGQYLAELMHDVQSIAASSGLDPILLALAAYNAGPGAVAAANGIPPYVETQAYVEKIPALAQQKYSGSCAPITAAAVAPGQWTSPLHAGQFTSGYGMRWGVLHAGIDISSGGGSPEYAVTAMTITWAGCQSDGYGCSVVGRATDGTGYMFRYGHMAGGTIAVSAGQSVPGGTRLGIEGATGQVTGPHLHFEIYLPGGPENAYASNGHPVDPVPILLQYGVTITGAG